MTLEEELLVLIFEYSRLVEEYLNRLREKACQK